MSNFDFFSNRRFAPLFMIVMIGGGAAVCFLTKLLADREWSEALGIYLRAGLVLMAGVGILRIVHSRKKPRGRAQKNPPLSRDELNRARSKLLKTKS